MEQGDSEILVCRDSLLERIGLAYANLPTDERLLVGVAGAPASGKSTIAEWLVERINAQTVDDNPAVMVPMDGYHLDNAILDTRGELDVKGAPHTFDVAGFCSLVQRLRRPLSESCNGGVYLPVFDRKMDLARCAASVVGLQHRIVIVEGNYLFLNRPVWSQLATCLDLRVFLDVPLDTLEQRLIQRWIDHGLDRQAAITRALSNDIPNARTVIQESCSAHFVLKGVRQ